MEMLQSGRHVHLFFTPDASHKFSLQQHYPRAQQHGPLSTNLEALAQTKLDPDMISFISGCIQVCGKLVDEKIN